MISFVHWINILYFIFVRLFSLCSWVHMYMCIFHYLNYYFPDFVTAICLGFIFGFSFLDICFTLPYCHNKPLVESSFLTRDQTLTFWIGSTDSRTLDYQRTNPREYQIVRTHTKETTWIQDPHHPTTSSTLWRMPHLNKQNKITSPVISRQDYTSLSLARQRRNKQANKNSAQTSPYTKLTQTTGPTLGGKKLKGRTNSTFFKEIIQLFLKPGKRRLQTQ